MHNRTPKGHGALQYRSSENTALQVWRGGYMGILRSVLISEGKPGRLLVLIKGISHKSFVVVFL